MAVLTKTLHPYQDEPVDGFLDIGCGLVSYETGLGKSPIAIAVAEELLGTEDITRVLLVVPGSLKWQWAQELVKFTDLPTTTVKLKGVETVVPQQEFCAVIDGKPYQKNKVKYSAADDRKRQYAAITPATQYVIMSYDTVVDDARYVKRLKPDLVVLDEATAIKSFGAERTKKIKLILQSQYRLAMTATPEENRPDEVFSIMQWVDEEVLGPYDLFEKTFIVRNKWGTVQRYKNLKLLHQKLSTRMWRKGRNDPEVKPYLPDRDESKWTVTLSKKQWAAYRVMAEDLLKDLENVRSFEAFDIHAYYQGQTDAGNSAVGKAMAKMQALDMFVDHPDLVVASAMAYEESVKQDKTAANWKGSKYCYKVWQDGLIDDVFDSAKLDLLLVKMDEILAFPESKALIFTKYRPMLDLLEVALPFESVQYHGGMGPSDKAGAVAEFRDPKVRLFLSSHAGAYGTNMDMANYLVNYDLALSSGRQDQINGRHDRVSSEFSKIYIRNLIAENTTNERDLLRNTFKRSLTRAVVDGQMSDRRGTIENDVISLTEHLHQVLDNIH